MKKFYKLLIAILLTSVILFLIKNTLNNISTNSGQIDNAKPCDKSVKLFTMDKVKDLKDKVLQAFLANNEAELINLAACDFMIEPGDAPDGAYYIRSTFAIPVLVKKLKGVSWESCQNEGSLVQFECSTVDKKYSLIFRRTNNDEGEWFWAGYLSLDTNELDSDAYDLPDEDTP